MSMRRPAAHSEAWPPRLGAPFYCVTRQLMQQSGGGISACRGASTFECQSWRAPPDGGDDALRVEAHDALCAGGARFSRAI